MKTFFCALLASGLLMQASQAKVIGQYDFNDLFTTGGKAEASYVSPCIELTDLYACCTPRKVYESGGVDNSGYVSFSGWDTNQYENMDQYLNRDALWQWPKTVSFKVEAGATSLGTLSGLSVDLRRPDKTATDSIMAAIFWEDASGVIQQRHSAPVVLTSNNVWETVQFDFAYGSSLFPTGTDYSGETFRIELYAWGQESTELFLDNVTLLGECAPVPEPSSALLLGLAGMTVILRRRFRIV